jgi:shikimate kinase
MKRHVALVGFMASGKSTIGRKLARRLGWPFVDTDSLVTRQHGTIAEIFEREGEQDFRRYEHEAIRGALESVERTVLALGGGALTLAANRTLLARHAYRVFIKISPEQILTRVRRSHDVRPLLGPAPTLRRIRELYAQRMANYERVDRVIDASRRSDASVIDEIVVWLRDRDPAGRAT